MIYSIAIILVVSVLMNKSPIYFVTALGAMSAVLLIVFRDTLLSMFANVIVTTGDLVRVGDWITVKGSDADGYVTEVSLNVVKVQNFDKTVTSLPTYTLVQKSFVNWRGMFDAGVGGSNGRFTSISDRSGCSRRASWTKWPTSR